MCIENENKQSMYGLIHIGNLFFEPNKFMKEIVFIFRRYTEPIPKI